MENGSVTRLNLARPSKPVPPQDLSEASDPLSDELATLREACERLRQTCEELRGDMDWLAGEVRSIRGHITGGSRRPKNGKEDAPQPVNDIEQINQLIRNGGTFRGR